MTRTLLATPDPEPRTPMTVKLSFDPSTMTLTAVTDSRRHPGQQEIRVQGNLSVTTGDQDSASVPIDVQIQPAIQAWIAGISASSDNPKVTLGPGNDNTAGTGTTTTSWKVSVQP